MTAEEPTGQAAKVDTATIAAAQAGDEHAFAAVYRAYSRQVYTLVRRLVSRKAVADELFQDVFVEILRSIGGYRGDGNFGGWIRSIAVNKCMSYLRSPWNRSLLWLDGESAASETSDTDELTMDAQLGARRDLEQALAVLPPLTRCVVWLHDVEDYTHAEIAQSMGRTVSFSKSQLARAHARLRNLLAPTETEVCTPVITRPLSN
jgi:RNA polymerase sigma factor (sigma-70 family)